MTSTSSIEKSQEETAPAPSEIEKLEAAQEKLKEAMGELEEALRAAHEEIASFKELEVFVHGFDTPVIFHPRLRSKVIDAWCDEIDSDKREGDLLSVSVVTTDEQWYSFGAWDAMKSSDVEYDEDEEEERLCVGEGTCSSGV